MTAKEGAPIEVPQKLVVTVMTDIGFNFNVLVDANLPMERLKGAPTFSYGRFETGKVLSPFHSYPVIMWSTRWHLYVLIMHFQMFWPVADVLKCIYCRSHVPVGGSRNPDAELQNLWRQRRPKNFLCGAVL